VQEKRAKNWRLITPVAVIAIIIATAFALWNRHEAFNELVENEKIELPSQLRAELTKSLVSMPAGESEIEISMPKENIHVQWSLDKKLEKFVMDLLKRWRSDYAAVVVIDNSTGKILAAVGYDGKEKSEARYLAFSSTHPAASLFKVVTSADLLENSDLSRRSILSYRGRGTTLYRYQLEEAATRWIRSITLGKAFALSNNVIFAKAAINHSNAFSLQQMANKFGFNSELMTDINPSPSFFVPPEDQYGLAEIASGFNDTTSMSPVHAAAIASAVANNGHWKSPSIIDSLSAGETGILPLPQASEREIISKATAHELQAMMRMTVEEGTARASFRRMRPKLRGELEIAGKTGSLTGGIPEGRRDWFMAYARPVTDEKNAGISICVMNVNGKKWRVKSTYLAKLIIEHYYQDLARTNKSVVRSRKLDDQGV
jgi:cell division protein FtsI/penicillin-binding protein 2